MECQKCHTKLPNAAKFCFNCGARVDDETAETGATATQTLHPRYVRSFFELIDSGDVRNMEQMLEATPELVHARLNERERPTPLHRAAETEHPNVLDIDRILKLLIDFGADVNAKTKSGFTPIHYALIANSLVHMTILQSLGAVMVDESTPLDDLLWMLVQNRADTALVHVLPLARRAGVDLNKSNADGETLLDRANSLLESLRFSYEHGGDDLIVREYQAAVFVVRQLRTAGAKTHEELQQSTSPTPGG